ncbi:hypothetical protein R2361_26865, partial [Mycobacteroides chelonae]|nr:hypothetical protein [Mycobacteroides chelonae]
HQQAVFLDHPQASLVSCTITLFASMAGLGAATDHLHIRLGADYSTLSRFDLDAVQKHHVICDFRPAIPD